MPGTEGAGWRQGADNREVMGIVRPPRVGWFVQVMQRCNEQRSPAAKPGDTLP